MANTRGLKEDKNSGGWELILGLYIKGNDLQMKGYHHWHKSSILWYPLVSIGKLLLYWVAILQYILIKIMFEIRIHNSSIRKDTCLFLFITASNHYTPNVQNGTPIYRSNYLLKKSRRLFSYKTQGYFLRQLFNSFNHSSIPISKSSNTCTNVLVTNFFFLPPFCPTSKLLQ